MAKQPTTIHKLYGGSVEIEFRENPYHTYTLLHEKKRLTSVTSVTGLIGFPKEVAMRWAIGLAQDRLALFLAERDGLVDKTELQGVITEALGLYCAKREKAADVGTLIHAWAESYARAKLEGGAMPDIGGDLPDQVVAGINGFLDFVNGRKVKFLEVERLVYSKEYGYAGLFDAVLEMGGKRYLADWKSSKGVYPEMYAQVAAYRAAYEEECGPVDGSLIVRFGKDDGSFEVLDTTDSYVRDSIMFHGLLATKERMKEIEATDRKKAKEAV